MLGEEDMDNQHLKAPSLGKLLFISPPPSPPCGWEIREEEPPNKDVHAEDLQRALAGLGDSGQGDETASPIDEEEREDLQGGKKMSGTGSLMVYHPRAHGDREDLPVVTVEDTTNDALEKSAESLGTSISLDVEGIAGHRIITHTKRPPMELIEDA